MVIRHQKAQEKCAHHGKNRAKNPVMSSQEPSLGWSKAFWGFFGLFSGALAL
jgi:hypothetical protein